MINQLSGKCAVPRQNGELVFNAPWQSLAFGMATALQQEGVFEWPEFQQALIDEIAAWEAEHTNLDHWSYYERWFNALESLLLRKNICRADQLRDALAAAIAQAAEDDHH